jgi:RimJ/RimL family protein N-acetyltransferase
LGPGYATEGARVADAAFTPLGRREIISITVAANTRSIHVMQRIGMQRDPAGDFDYPRLAEGDPLRRHVHYRIGRERWEEMGEKH